MGKDHSNYSDCVLFSGKYLHLVLVFRYLIWRQRGYAFKGLRIVALDGRYCSSSTTGQKSNCSSFHEGGGGVGEDIDIIWFIIIMKLFSCSASCYLCVVPLFLTPLGSLEYQEHRGRNQGNNCSIRNLGNVVLGTSGSFSVAHWCVQLRILIEIVYPAEIAALFVTLRSTTHCFFFCL